MAATKATVKMRKGFPTALGAQIHPEDKEAAQRFHLYWYHTNINKPDPQREGFMAALMRYAIKGAAEDMAANAEDLNVQLLKKRVELMKLAHGDNASLDWIHEKALEVENLDKSVLDAYLAEEEASVTE